MTTQKWPVFLGLLVAISNLLASTSSSACSSPSSSSAQTPEVSKPVEVVLRGKAITLSAAIKIHGLKVQADADLADKQVVVLGPDGSVVPLLSDDASRAMFVDGRLRDRPVEVKGLRLDGLPYLQVVTFKIEEEGRLRTPEYYCNICTISVRFPQICPCCQGPMELRMKPERP